jgi:Na+/alanine symporter
MGGIQMVEIIINCNYVKQNNEKTCYISAFQYMINKYNNYFKGKNTSQYILKIAGIYAILAITISFFSAVLFQVEQFGNVFYRHFHSVNVDQFVVLAIFGPILLAVFLIATFSHFKHGLKFNSVILPPILIIYLVVLILFLIFNFDKFIIVSIQIIDDIFNPDGIINGIISGAVISFARYIYKSRDYREDVWHIYEESDEKKSILMYGLESFFMIFLIIISGTSYIIIENFSEELFLGLSVKYFLVFSLLFFALSLIINEAFYGRIVLSHIIRFGQKNLNIIIRLIMIFGVILGLLKQADQLVDIADHLSIIFLIINLVSVLFIIKDLKFFINRLKNLE